MAVLVDRLLSAADISHGVFHARLNNPSFLKALPSIAIYPLLNLLSWNLIVRCLAVTGGVSVGEGGDQARPCRTILIWPPDE